MDLNYTSNFTFLDIKLLFTLLYKNNFVWIRY